MGGGDKKPPQKTDRSELNDLLNSSPDTQFLGNSPSPTPTVSPITKQASDATMDILARLGVFT